MWPAVAAFSIQFPQRFAMGVETATSFPYTTIRLLQVGSFRDLKPTQFTVAKGKAIDRAREKLWLSPAEQRQAICSTSPRHTAQPGIPPRLQPKNR